MAHNNNISHHPAKTVGSGNTDIQEEILRAVEALKQGSGFGSVEIVLHEGRITQIEKREKLRFQHNASIDVLKK